MASAVLFDCDGVLVESEIIAREVELAVLSEIGLDYDPHEFTTRFMGRSDAAFFALLDEDARSRLGRSILGEIRGPMKERYFRALDARLVEVDGALAAIRACTHRKAVASSSTPAGLEKKLKKVGHWDHFAPHIYSAAHVEHAKPAPDLFLHAAKALDAAPRDCIVIEDSVNGVTAGVAAGMRVWGFTGGSHMSDRMADSLRDAGAERILTHWSEAAALFAGL